MVPGISQVGITMHVENIYGDNSHYIIESCYKALARSLREALEMDLEAKKVFHPLKAHYKFNERHYC